MPGCATRQLPLFQKQNVRHTSFGQVIGDTRTDDATTDNDYLGSIRKLNSHGPVNLDASLITSGTSRRTAGPTARRCTSLLWGIGKIRCNWT